MEINYKNVTFYRHYNSSIEKKIINNLNLSIPVNKISAFVGGEEKSVAGKMICALEIPSIGMLKVGNYIIEKNRHIKNVNKLRFEIGYLYSDPEKFLFNSTVKKEIEYGMKHYNYKTSMIKERPIDALKLVGLDESYYKRNPMNLSLSEQKKVMLASVLAYNPKTIIFDEFEKGLNFRDRKNLIRLIKMLKNKYKRTIIIISNDLNFMLDFVDYYYIFENGDVVFNCTKEDLYNKGVEKFIELPELVNFVLKAQNKGSKIPNYYELNELIKGVYRDVK